MKHKALAFVSIVLLYATAIIFGVSVQQARHNRIYPEVQLPSVTLQKKLELEMLHQYGYISSEEWQLFSEETHSNLSSHEYNALIDKMLVGREAEIAKSYAKLEEETDEN